MPKAPPLPSPTSMCKMSDGPFGMLKSDSKPFDPGSRRRNGKAFEILSEELVQGKEKLAVFYGAGHLPDMAERLERDFEMRAKKTTWLDAWDLTRN